MNKIETGFDGLFILEPKIFNDERGYFYESFNKKTFDELGLFSNFIQDNQSLSHEKVLRGLHFQYPPHDQIKLVRVVTGSAIDFVVDLRKNSKTYGKQFSTLLSNINKHMLYIPEGFAHGFLSLENNTLINYKCSSLYDKESEGCLLWDDKTVNLKLPFYNDLIISEKDKLGLPLNEISYE
jgi:dTDP-4-dehydrorhamnose 3,5-epimerase